jgi:ABC-type branched-subunit amino acid transport system ATPase component
MSVALSVSELTVGYGGLVANDHVSLEVRSGQVVGLIGPNGAGKSTFVDAVSGFTRYTGSVALGPRPLDGLPPHKRRRLGLSRTWQSVELFDDLGVRANVAAAHRTVTPWSFVGDLVRPGRHTESGEVDEILRSMDLGSVATAMPGQLSLGQRKRLGVARALAGHPSVTLLDEPASGLDPSERRQLGERIRGLAAEGLGVLLIEHDVDMVLATCDWVVVLDFGRVIASGPPAAIRDDVAVADAYLGDRFRQAVPG